MVNTKGKIGYYRKAGFTYVELLVTLVILAVLFIPVMQLFSHSLYSTGYSRDLITATNLTKWQVERIKNLNISKEQLRAKGDEIYPLEMNGLRWRIKTEVVQKSDPLEIRVHAYSDNDESKPVVTIVTLIEDMTWEEIRPVS